MSKLEPARDRPILLAEDEDTDALLFRLAMKATGLLSPLVVARDGQEAIDYLMGTFPFSDRRTHPLPALLVLDLKMPRMTGFDVLSWLASRPDLSVIPAIVLSSSSYPEDIQMAVQLGAREFYIKPHSVHELAGVVQAATERWLKPFQSAA